VVTRTGMHQRCVLMMRWFGGRETVAFDHQRWRPNAQRWLAAANRTRGRMRMRRGSTHEEELRRVELTEVSNGGGVLCEIWLGGGQLPDD
jgi:hypothetical protein